MSDNEEGLTLYDSCNSTHHDDSLQLVVLGNAVNLEWKDCLSKRSHLQSLILNCVKPNDSLLEALRNEPPSRYLRQVCLEELGSDAIMVPQLFKLLYTFTSIQSLSLRGSLRREYLTDVTGLLTHLPQLDSLDLSYNTTISNALHKFNLLAYTKLETLTLMQCKLTHNDLYSISKCAQLKQVVLDGNTHSTLAQGIAKYFTKLPNLTHLSVAGCNIGDADFVWLFQFLASLKHLESLNIGSNNLRNVTPLFDYLYSALENGCEGPKYLNVSHNDIESSDDLATLMTIYYTCVPTFRELHVDGNGYFYEEANGLIKKICLESIHVQEMSGPPMDRPLIYGRNKTRNKTLVESCLEY